MGKKIILGAAHSVIEPLSLLHLSTIAKQEGYIPEIVLVKDENFGPIREKITEVNPEYVGFQSFTGNHKGVFNFYDDIKGGKVKTILGGPHATYFPKDSSHHADYVVVSEGFNSFRKILRGEAEKGIVALTEREEFPEADRNGFYKTHISHRDNPIKSLITKTGCPYSCTYCYNSSSIDDIKEELSLEQFKKMSEVLGKRGRLFADSQRSVKDVLKEIDQIKESAPETKMLYFQDDVFGAKLSWLKEFAQKYDKSLSYHAQLRFEYSDPKKSSGKERLDILRESGCTGLTFAIESANPTVRREVLNRNMANDLMFNSLHYAKSLGFNVRTEQMLGLPLGATTKETPVNIDADLETLKLNVELREETGLPDMAWTSIFVPYNGTDIAKHCINHGFSKLGSDDIPVSFFEGSTMRFPKKWIGPGLSSKNPSHWLSEKDQRQYEKDLIDLKSHFSVFARFPRGHELARDFLKQEDRSAKALDDIVKKHLFDRIIYKTL
ncbi:MAG: radical SAM protein [archaeon]